MKNIITEAYYENIDIKLYEEIQSAEKSIYLAIGWITDEKLFNLLVNKSILGCEIKLFIRNDSMNRNSKINFHILSNGHSKVYMIEGLHDKICIIDFTTIITGSYNWTNNAKINHENIQIIKNDFKLIQKYINEKFKVLADLCKDDSANFELTTPLNRIIKRLKILKNYVSDDFCQKINFEINLLSTLNIDSDLLTIKEFIIKFKLIYSLKEIEKFYISYELEILSDSELSELKKEIKELQEKLITLENEKNDIEKMLSDYQNRHSSELGQIILDILKCKKLKFNPDELDYDEADKTEENYRRIFESQKSKRINTLNELEQKNLKKLYRKAAKLCHPDKINFSFKDLAHEIFHSLKIAYDNNDINTITSIIEQLENGDLNQKNNEVVSEKNSLFFFAFQLKNSIANLEKYISEIKSSEAYKNIVEISDWDLYFENLRKELSDELSNLNSELSLS